MSLISHMKSLSFWSLPNSKKYNKLQLKTLPKIGCCRDVKYSSRTAMATLFGLKKWPKKCGVLKNVFKKALHHIY